RRFMEISLPHRGPSVCPATRMASFGRTSLGPRRAGGWLHEQTVRPLRAFSRKDKTTGGGGYQQANATARDCHHPLHRFFNPRRTPGTRRGAVSLALQQVFDDLVAQPLDLVGIGLLGLLDVRQDLD